MKKKNWETKMNKIIQKNYTLQHLKTQNAKRKKLINKKSTSLNSFTKTYMNQCHFTLDILSPLPSPSSAPHVKNSSLSLLSLLLTTTQHRLIHKKVVTRKKVAVELNTRKSSYFKQISS